MIKSLINLFHMLGNILMNQMQMDLMEKLIARIMYG